MSGGEAGAGGTYKSVRFARHVDSVFVFFFLFLVGVFLNNCLKQSESPPVPKSTTLVDFVKVV